MSEVRIGERDGLHPPEDAGRRSPGDEDGVVVVSHPVFRNAVAVAVMRQDGLLPFAEAVQRLVSVVIDLQVGLQGNTGSERVCVST